MEQDFWNERWTEGKIAFHQPAGHPLLPRYLPQFPKGRVLVPLAGKTLDILTLHQAGYDVVAIEFIESAVRTFADEHPELALQPLDGPLGCEWRCPRLRFMAADFFAAKNTELGRFDLVYDRAALIALPPDTQPRYVDHLRSLVAPKGEIMALTFDYDASTMQGPPFSTPPDVVTSLYSGANVSSLITKVLEPNPLATRGCGPLKEHAFRIVDAAQ